MSGHSHYATIKRQKESRDAARGRIFSKLGRAIHIAVKIEGSPDPDANAKLRMAIETARSFNMPKENIERAITSAAKSTEALEEVFYEGFAPGGVGVIVEAATDNRNRTGQEIKNLFERRGGSLGGPGSVSFNFEPKGFLVVEKTDKPEEQMLSLIDAGVEDLEELDDGVEVYVAPDKLTQVRDKVKALGFKLTSYELVMRPKNLQTITDIGLAKKVLAFLENLEDQDDVQKVYANLDIPQEVLDKIKSDVKT